MAASMPRLARTDPAARALPRKFNFTRAALDRVACPPGMKAVTVYDAKVSGLAYTVRWTGFRAFYWYGRVRGHHAPVRHQIGGDEFSVDLARDRAKKLALDAKDGIHPRALFRARLAADRKRRRFGALWEEYRDKKLRPHGRPSYVASEESIYRTWVSRLADHPIDEIDAGTLERLHATIAAGEQRTLAKGKRGKRQLGGRRAANRAMGLIRRIFKHEDKQHPLAQGVVKLFPQASRERFLSGPELRRFLEALAAEPDETARDFLELCLYTGARRGNVLSMRWDEIQLGDQRWTIPAAKAKGHKSIAIHLAEPAMEILRRRRAADRRGAFVFPSSRSRTGHYAEPRYAFERVCAAAKVEGLTLHDLRRTMASWQAALGTSLPIIGKSLGHANLASTQVYARLDLSAVRASVDAAAAAMRAAAEAPEKGGEGHPTT